MSRPITPTPKLNKKATHKFLKMVEEGLKNPVGPIPTPNMDETIRQIMSNESSADQISALNAALSAGYMGPKKEEFNPNEELEKAKKLADNWNKKCLKKGE